MFRDILIFKKYAVKKQYDFWITELTWTSLDVTTLWLWSSPRAWCSATSLIGEYAARALLGPAATWIRTCWPNCPGLPLTILGTAVCVACLCFFITSSTWSATILSKHINRPASVLSSSTTGHRACCPSTPLRPHTINYKFYGLEWNEGMQL